MNINENNVLVINMFLDIYNTNSNSWNECDKKYNFKWCGIHFHDVESRIRVINSLKNNIFLIFLIKDLIKNIIIKKIFIYLSLRTTKKKREENILEKIKYFCRGQKNNFYGWCNTKEKTYRVGQKNY